MTVKVKQCAADIDLTPAPNYFELRNNNVRLRPHSPDNAAWLCDIAGGPFPSVNTGARTGRTITPEYARDSNFIGMAIRQTAPIAPFAGYESMQNFGGSFFLNPQSDDINQDEFTEHVWLTISGAAFTSRTIASEYIAVAGLARFRVYVNNTTNIILYLYNAAGGATTVSVTLSAAIANGDTLYIKFGYSKSTTSAFLRVYRWTALTWEDLGNGSTNVAPSLPTPIINETSLHAITSEFTLYNLISLPFPSNIHSIRRYTTYDSSAIAARPTTWQNIYDALQSGAVVTFDSGYSGSSWNPATFTVDDNTQWAAAVGNEGYTLKYEIADVPAGAWSAEMTRADFLNEAAATGRYLKIQLYCRSNGINNYEIELLSCDADIQPPNTPDISSLTRNCNTGVATVTGAEAGDTVLIWGHPYAAQSNTVELVGSAIAVGGDTTVNLDFSMFPALVFMGVNLNAPVACEAQLVRHGLYSRISSTSWAGLLIGSWTPSITSVVRSADRLSAQVTVTGIPVGEVCMIGWIKDDGNPDLAAFTGSGTFTVNGLQAGVTFSPLIIGYSCSAAIEALVGYAEPRTQFYTRSIDISAFHSEDI